MDLSFSELSKTLDTSFLSLIVDINGYWHTCVKKSDNCWTIWLNIFFTQASSFSFLFILLPNVYIVCSSLPNNDKDKADLLWKHLTHQASKSRGNKI